jgi:diacylglycerol kinase (ATP)
LRVAYANAAQCATQNLLTLSLVQSSYSMRKAALLYNPLSGRIRARRAADMEAVQAELTAGGVDVSTVTTRSSRDTTDQTRAAIAAGCDTIFACGGDGTINDVLQSLVGSQAALGVIPLGTANALAHDLGLPLSPRAAARAALTAQPRRIAVGEIVYRDFSGKSAQRYFSVTAGVGVDAHLFYELNTLVKGHGGMLAYYLKALHLWLTHEMKFFDVEFVTAAGQPARVSVSELLAVRITNFGGILRELAPGASILRNDVRLVLFKTDNRWSYLRYVIRGMIGAQWKVRDIELESVDKVTCLADEEIHVEADGDLLGTLPAEISVLADGFTILQPQ